MKRVRIGPVLIVYLKRFRERECSQDYDRSRLGDMISRMYEAHSGEIKNLRPGIGVQISAISSPARV